MDRIALPQMRQPRWNVAGNVLPEALMETAVAPSCLALQDVLS